ncbi:MAG: peptidoglycan editing factor PgeF [Armatimonadetes bacterium]|nr:peptidoglycan editing factor PgeF [Armatimonadota bacterium]
MKKYILHKKNNLIYFSFPHFPSDIINIFTSRIGGISPPPYDSLNLGETTLDLKTNILENKKRLEKILNLNLTDFLKLNHSGKVVILNKNPKGKISADALITNKSGIALTIYYADCVPIFIFDRARKCIALIHAGWRGSFKKITEKTLKKMKKYFKTNPEDCLAGIASSIGPCCFSVKKDIAEKFLKIFPSWQDILVEIPNELDRKWSINLWELNLRQLIKSGVKEKNIISSGLCTSCNDLYFYSYRRDKRNTGRMASIFTFKS